MTTTIGTATRRIYVACLGSYNEGRLHGEWIDASSDADELYEQVNAMLAKSKLDFGRKAEEFAIHDHEGYPDGLIGEYSGMETIAKIEEAMEQLSDYPEDAVMAYLSNQNGNLDALESFSDHYHGEWESGAAYAEEFHRSTGSITDDTPLSSYINWDAVWTGEFECGDYWTATGSDYQLYVFSG